ncbi:MAG: hypothetical protein CVT48_05640 [Thermoplasmata archaeon HGW-Thermoplasmata-1]|nr:MAG: hypothetical protein CVT48_05640 [Thermoplasmata archaeon HGW-Thermoplasmata-1]
MQGNIKQEYQKISEVYRETATKDLALLIDKAIFRTIGEGRKDLKYILVQNASKMRQKPK